MSFQQIGSVAGAVIGNYLLPGVGGFIGGAIGGYVGSSFDPPIRGPRIEDLKAQSSEYGRPIPIIYGTVALAGNVIWASDLIEVERDVGGKGGPEVLAYSYFANFAVAICEGGESLRLGRIWAGPDKRLIWDGATLEGEESGAQLRFYTGAADQEPDPLMESYLGAGNVPAYRGTCYLVIENFPVEKDANRIPFLTIEVGNVDVEAQENTAPDQLGVWLPLNTFMYEDQGTAVWSTFYVGTYYGVITRRQDDLTLVKHFTYDLSEWSTIQKHYLMDTANHLFVRPASSLGYTTFAMSNGAKADHTYTAAVGDSNPGTQVMGGIYHLGQYIFAAKGSSGAASRITLYVVDPATGTCTATYCGDAAGGELTGPLLAPADPEDEHVYCVMAGTPTRLVKVAIESNFTPVDMGAPVQSPHWIAVDPYTGRRGLEVVDADHALPLREQVLAEMRAEEPGPAGDDACAHRSNSSPPLGDC